MNPPVIKLVSKPGCPYCDHAKELLEDMEAPYELEFLDPTKDPEGYQTRRDELVVTTGAKTFPFIFLEGAFLGGFQQLVHANDTGRLAEAYQRAGIRIREVSF